MSKGAAKSNACVICHFVESNCGTCIQTVQHLQVCAVVRLTSPDRSRNHSSDKLIRFSTQNSILNPRSSRNSTRDLILKIFENGESSLDTRGSRREGLSNYI